MRGQIRMRSNKPISVFRRVFCFAAICLAMASMLASCLSAQSTTAGSSEKPGQVAATVNGEPIYKQDILDGIPADVDPEFVGDLRDTKLQRCITHMLIFQLAKAQKITYSDAEADKRVNYMRENPPSLGCACCRYPSLESFMQVNGFTLKELKQDIETKLILEQYADRLWEAKYSSEQARKKLIGEQREQAEKYYARIWHIFFNIIQKPDYPAQPTKVSDEMKTKAEAAWKRLQSGEPFADIARQVSEDQLSRDKGGALGLASKYAFGPEFADAVSQLKSGEYSKPFRSAWGYHIAKVEPLTDNDILEIAKMDFEDESSQKVVSKLQKQAKIVISEKPDQLQR